MTLQEQMLDMLTSAYNRRKDGNIGKLMGIFAEGLEKASAALTDIREWRDLYTAKGRVLDRMGVNYGVPREGADDDTYRLMIVTKMLAAYSGGDPDTLISAAAALMDMPDAAIRLSEGTAAVTLTMDELEVPTGFFARQDTVCDMLQQVVAAGIRLTLEFQQPVYQQLYAGFALHICDNITIRQVV